LGRNTQGVRVIRLKEGEELVRMTRIEESDEVAADVPSDAESEND
jgi:DNA gyrase subunit A